MYKIPTVKEIKLIPSKNVHIISLFAGGGGCSTGYRMAGGKVILANEFIPLAADTYLANWPDTIMLRDDVRKLNPYDVLETVNLKPYELDVLDGSPPCCAFSAAGKKEKGWGKVRNYSGGRTVSNAEDLFFEYIRFLKAIKPKVFIAENVKGLICGASKGYFNIIFREMKKAGYYAEARLLNSAYLGVPQKRERVIFVGIRNDLMKREYAGNLHPKPVNKFISLKEAFEGLNYDYDAIEKMKEGMKKYAVYSELLKLKPLEKSKKYYALCKDSPDYPGYTLMANNHGGVATHYHWDNRPFTVEELKRIQSLPDDYILLGNYEKQAERIGRMVPPLMAKAVLENLINSGAAGC
jgi:DNA (cytosine-5)-methyltransferase 1